MSSFDPSIFKADGLLAANRALDLGGIDAVGFDLDHTLALYDDDAVNALAMAEAQDLLVAERGYRSGEVVVAPHVHDVAVARALAIDLATAHVVKLDAGRRVHVARRGGTWVADAAIVRAHPHPAPDDRERVHPLSSRFDVPTMWLFDAVTRGCEPHRTLDPAAVCRDVREMLDWSHTRGDLKTHLRRELARFVSPVEGVIARLHAWRDAGKRLFVVTNSDTSFAIAVLDLVIGSSWRSMFSVVATSSAKPRFFDGARKGEKPPGADGVVIEGASA
ncbi:MAG TPA: 5'-nucleotidase domain-containing protein, partial [Candidatus Krumholzibacteria bacterium]|nr:5'-nucleotidase domain-containing protein [Candidatus Krumholzibacteria bacterium]